MISSIDASTIVSHSHPPFNQGAPEAHLHTAHCKQTQCPTAVVRSEDSRQENTNTCLLLYRYYYTHDPGIRYEDVYCPGLNPVINGSGEEGL